MRISSLLALAAPVVALVSSALVQAQPMQWRLLAFKTVGAGTDRDTIHVNRAERYRFIQLCSFNAPIHMVDFKVRFENGKRQDVHVRNIIAARSCTRAIRLDGNNARRIQRVDLTYQRVQRGVRTPLIRVMVR